MRRGNERAPRQCAHVLIHFLRPCQVRSAMLAEEGDRAHCDLNPWSCDDRHGNDPIPDFLGRDCNLWRPQPSKPLLRRAWWARLSPRRHQGENQVGQLFIPLTLWFWLTISRLNFVSGATVFEIKGASIRRLCQWLSGMINILSLNELSPVLMRFSSPRYQHLGSQAEELARQST